MRENEFECVFVYFLWPKWSRQKFFPYKVPSKKSWTKIYWGYFSEKSQLQVQFNEQSIFVNQIVMFVIPKWTNLALDIAALNISKSHSKSDRNKPKTWLNREFLVSCSDFKYVVLNNENELVSLNLNLILKFDQFVAEGWLNCLIALICHGIALCTIG